MVDDGSKDSTADVVLKFATSNNMIKLLKLGKNRGKGGAVKRGVQASLGKYILMVHC